MKKFASLRFGLAVVGTFGGCSAERDVTALATHMTRSCKIAYPERWQTNHSLYDSGIMRGLAEQLDITIEEVNAGKSGPIECTPDTITRKDEDGSIRIKIGHLMCSPGGRDPDLGNDEMVICYQPASLEPAPDMTVFTPSTLYDT